jgi:hypothetical protein
VTGADLRVGGYDWRLTLTDDPDNRVPLPEPDRYVRAPFLRPLNGHRNGGLACHRV